MISRIALPHSRAGTARWPLAWTAATGSRRRSSQPQSLSSAQSLEDARLDSSAWPADQWWRAYGDPQLDALVDGGPRRQSEP